MKSSVSRYLFQTFLTYFLSIVLVVSLLSGFYFRYAIPKIQEEYIQSVNRSMKQDVDKLSYLLETIYNDACFVSTLPYLRDIRLGEYEDNVYSYVQMNSVLNQFVLNNEAIDTASLYIHKTAKVLSSGDRITDVIEYPFREQIDESIKQQKNNFYFENDNSIFIITTLPYYYYYYDNSVLLIFSVSKPLIFQQYDNSNIFLAYQKQLIIGEKDRWNQIVNMMPDHMTSHTIYRNEDKNDILWYAVEPYSELIIVRLYKGNVLKQVIWSGIKVTLLVILIVLIGMMFISVLIAKKQTQPVIQLSKAVLGKYIDTNCNIVESIIQAVTQIQNQNQAYIERLEQNKVQIREHAIGVLLRNNLPDNITLHEYLKQSFIDVIPEYLYAVLIQIKKDNKIDSINKSENINLIIKDSIETRLKEQGILVGSNFMDLNQIVFICKAKEHIFQAEEMGQLSELFEKITNELKKHMEICCRIIIGYPVRTVESLSTCFIEMKKQMNKTNTTELKVGFISRDNNMQRVFPLHFQTELITSVKKRNEEKIDEVLRNVVEYENNIGNSQGIEMAIFLLVSNTLMELINSTNDIDQSNIEILNIFRQNATIENKIENLKMELVKISTQMDLVADKDDIHEYIIRAKQYIDENYTHDMSMAEIAEYLGINTSYFSRIFKQQSGMTPLQYITELRMNKSKELLKENLSIQKIAQMLGYNDVRSFIRFFKKTVGCTPGEYRTQTIKSDV